MALVATGLSPVSGCVTSDSGKKETKVEIVSEEDTKRAVDEYAIHIATAAGGELKNIGVNAASCAGAGDESSRSVYYVQGSSQVFVPEERHAAILASLWDSWRQQGFTMEVQRSASAGGSDELAVNSPDGFRIRLISTEPPTALSLLIHSPCRARP